MTNVCISSLNWISSLDWIWQGKCPNTFTQSIGDLFLYLSWKENQLFSLLLKATMFSNIIYFLWWTCTERFGLNCWATSSWRAWHCISAPVPMTRGKLLYNYSSLLSLQCTWESHYRHWDLPQTSRVSNYPYRPSDYLHCQDSVVNWLPVLY